MLRTYKVFPKILVEGKNEWSESSREVLPGPEAASKGWKEHGSSARVLESKKDGRCGPRPVSLTSGAVCCAETNIQAVERHLGGNSGLSLAGS